MPKIKLYRIYSYLAVLAFVIAASAVQCVDRFPHSILPMAIMVGAGLMSLISYFVFRNRE